MDEIPLVPAFSSSIFSYTLVATLSVHQSRLLIAINYTLPGSVQLQLDSGLAVQVGAGGWDAPTTFNLTSGMHVLTILSSVDGSYTVAVMRAAQDLLVPTGAGITTNTTNGTTTGVPSLQLLTVNQTGAAASTLILSPAFSADVYTFQVPLIVPFQEIGVRVGIRYATAGSVLLVVNDISYPAGAGDGTLSSPIPLRQGANQIIVVSAIDGNYTIDVHREIDPAVLPIARCSVPARVYPCTLALLDGRASSRGVASVRLPGSLSFTWSLVSVRVNDTDLAVAASLRLGEDLGFWRTPEYSLLALEWSRMQSNATYTFQLVVEDSAIHQSATCVVSTVVDGGVGRPLWQPDIQIAQPAAILRAQPATFAALFTPSSCSNMPLDTIITYEWRLQCPALPTQTFPLGGDSEYRIEAHTLVVGVVYDLVLNVHFQSATGAPVSTFQRRLLASQNGVGTIQLQFTAAASELIAVIAGGDRVRPFSSDHLFDASASDDPDSVIRHPPDLKFVWQCEEQPDGALPSVCPTLPSTAWTSSRLVLPSQSVPVGATLRLWVSINSLTHTSAASASVFLTVVADSPSIPLVSIVDAPSLTSSTASLALRGEVGRVDGTSADHFALHWTCAGPQHTTVDLEDPRHVQCAIRSLSLCVAAGVLQLPGDWTSL